MPDPLLEDVELLAEEAYGAYVKSFSEDGCVIEENWDDLEPIDREAWRAAIRHVMEVTIA